MNSEQKRLEELKEQFIEDVPINPKSALRNFSKFDQAVIDTLTELQDRFADNPAEEYIITDEMQKLGFILKDGSGIAGCSTIPCFGGKMPYQNEPTIGCAIGRTMCDQSPIQSIRETKEFEKAEAALKEQTRLKKNRLARERYAQKKNRKATEIWNEGGRGGII